MEKVFMLILVCTLLLAVVYAPSTGTAAQEMGERSTALLVEKAVAFLKANGKDASFAEFNKSNGKFSDGSRYVYVVDSKGNTLAHGGNSGMIGKNLYELKDSDMKPFMKEIINNAMSEGFGWVDYKWPNLPISNKAVLRSAYFKKVNDVIIISSTLK